MLAGDSNQLATHFMTNPHAYAETSPPGKVPSTPLGIGDLSVFPWSVARSPRRAAIPMEGDGR